MKLCAHPGRTNTNKHLQELGAVDRDEGHVGLAGRCFGQESLSSSWRTRQDGALHTNVIRGVPAEPGCSTCYSTLPGPAHTSEL